MALLRHSTCRKEVPLYDSIGEDKICKCRELPQGLCAKEAFQEADRKIRDDAKLTAELLAAITEMRHE